MVIVRDPILTQGGTCSGIETLACTDQMQQLWSPCDMWSGWHPYSAQLQFMILVSVSSGENQSGIIGRVLDMLRLLCCSSINLSRVDTIFCNLGSWSHNKDISGPLRTQLVHGKSVFHKEWISVVSPGLWGVWIPRLIGTQLPKWGGDELREEERGGERREGVLVIARNCLGTLPFTTAWCNFINRLVNFRRD